MHDCHDILPMIYCLQLPCATFLMSSTSSSPIDIARDNTAPICCLLSHVLVRPATSCKLCVITSAIDSISSIWTACKSVAVVVCMTTKHVCMRAVSARPYLGCLRLGSQETSESAKSLDQPHDHSATELQAEKTKGGKVVW